MQNENFLAALCETYFLSYVIALANGRVITLDSNVLEVTDTDGTEFVFGYVGSILPADMENFIDSVATDASEDDWKLALEEDSAAPHSAIFQV